MSGTAENAPSTHLTPNIPLTDESPSFANKLLFFLLLSGPPKLRLRDPSASLNDEIDWVIVLQLIVWGIAGCWVLLNYSYTRRRRTATSQSSSLPTLSVLLIALLSLSIFFSEAPVFCAFKVYQLAITFAFVMLFTRRFGINETLQNLFLGCGILTLADILAAFVMPDLVFVESELGSMRFRGDLIAQTGCVSVIGLILLLTAKSDLPKKWFFFWAMTFGSVLVLSLMRTSYLVLLFVFLLAALRRPAIPVLRRVATISMLALPLVADMLITALNAERKVEDIWTLSERVGLWSYLIDATLDKGPYLGLGYFAASRIYAPQFNPNLGTAHSAFMEIYVGGGFVTLIAFLLIWMVLSWKVLRLYFTRSGKTEFAIVALFCAALFLNAIGGELQADPSGFCFWCVIAAVAVLPHQHPSLALPAPSPHGRGASVPQGA